MRLSSLLFVIIVLISVISLLSIWLYPSVKDFVASNNMWNGLRNFSRELGANDIDSLSDLPDSPEKTILVVIPYLEFSNDELSTTKQFISDGGSLLLMDDYGYGNSLLAYLEVTIRFSNQPLLDPLFNYKNQWLPRITDLNTEVKESGIDAIVLNHATSLTDVLESQVIAWSSSASFLDTNENGYLDTYEPVGPLPVATQFQLGKGMVAIVSDPSIVINSMIAKDGNYAFIKYLITGDDEPKRVLLDSSHLTKAPLDVSKMRLRNSREVLSSPYSLLGIVALIFIVVSRYTLMKPLRNPSP